MLNIVLLMADYGHDPTGEMQPSRRFIQEDETDHLGAETTLPYTAFKAAGYNVVFATEAGKAPACDTVLLKGITQKILVTSPPPPPSCAKSRQVKSSRSQH